MTIEEAIERNKKLPLPLKTANDYNNQEAVRLGIEALKAVKDARANNYYTPIATMPGETLD